MAGMEDQIREMREAFAAQLQVLEAQRQQLEQLTTFVTQQRAAGAELQSEVASQQRAGQALV